MTIEWRIEVQGKPQTQTGTRMHVAVHRALVGYSLPEVGQEVVIRVTRVRTVPPVKRRGY